MPPKASGTSGKKRSASPAEVGATQPAARRSVRAKPTVNYNEDRLVEAIEVAAAEASVRVISSQAALTNMRVSRPIPTSDAERAALLPKRDAEGRFHFPDFPAFRPNLSPEEVLRAGSFGGTYFRPIRSSVLGGRTLERAWEDEVSAVGSFRWTCRVIHTYPYYDQLMMSPSFRSLHPGSKGYASRHKWPAPHTSCLSTDMGSSVGNLWRSGET